MSEQKPGDPESGGEPEGADLPIEGNDAGAAGEGRSGVAEVVRRALLAGVGAVFLTEEGIRRTVSDLRLPKEALGYLAAQADRTRAEAGRILRKELRGFLNSEAFRRQIQQMLSGVTVEIRAEVRLRPDSGKPEVGATVRVKPPGKPEENQEDSPTAPEPGDPR